MRFLEFQVKHDIDVSFIIYMRTIVILTRLLPTRRCQIGETCILKYTLYYITKHVIVSLSNIVINLYHSLTKHNFIHRLTIPYLV